MTQPILPTDVGAAHTAVGATLLLLMEATAGQQETPAAPGVVLMGLSLQEEEDSCKTLPPQPCQSVLLLIGSSKPNINQMVKRVIPARRAHSRRM